MQQQQGIRNIPVSWRGNKFNVEMNSGATLREFGDKLQSLTDVKADTLRLIVPSHKSSTLLSPFSDEHSCLALQGTSIFEGKTVRMMGVPKDEVDQILQNTKADLRIPGFDEEEKRLRQRTVDISRTSLKLPQGNYIFANFRTLHIPGMVLTPPASEALKLMHMLAADPGIVAIMNKHRWRVGIMTEMAPEGYVGVSPKCLLGFNLNHGEEISLRLRTDDLKGFRKYDSIKKTLLHELAHMVHSEHDANFFALNKQLNQEAANLDWTRSRSHTLSGVRHSEHYEPEVYVGNSSSLSQKLGGKASDQLINARASSVAAAYRRLANPSTNLLASEVDEKLNPSDSGFHIHREPDHFDAVRDDELNIGSGNQDEQNMFEPDPDDSEGGEAMEHEPYTESCKLRISSEPDPDDREMTQFLPSKAHQEPDHNATEVPFKDEVVVNQTDALDEPDPDESIAGLNKLVDGDVAIHEWDKLSRNETNGNQSQVSKNYKEPDPDESQEKRVQAEPDPDDSILIDRGIFGTTAEPDPDDQDLRRIKDPVTLVCRRLQSAIENLQSEIDSSEAVIVLQTLFKIIRNLISHPDDMKYRKLRKANPVIQKNVANYKAAMDILFLIGFHEDVVLDEIGREETFLVLKRDDPGLLWLAKSSLETCIIY
ncbi:hypothetical protein RJ639_027547 [Escallonia herrerae]|uniref:WLM domain-containing protein n=1 Tax=Escallonia herrerae TaxID=1293975 RepID=A0AA88X3Z9_9ASTE|nr:hypothetical protein RJ639_027547 [Escallonia herrerae]